MNNEFTTKNKIDLSGTKLSYTILHKDDSKVYEKHELSDKSLPEFFHADFEPMILDNALYHSTKEDYVVDKAQLEQEQINKIVKETHDKDMKFFKKVIAVIFSVLALIFITTFIVVKLKTP